MIGWLARTGERPTAGEVRTVRDLLECWVAHHLSREDIRFSSREAGRAAARRLVRSDLALVQVDRLGAPTLERHRDAELRVVPRARPSPAT